MGGYHRLGYAKQGEQFQLRPTARAQTQTVDYRDLAVTAAKQRVEALGHVAGENAKLGGVGDDSFGDNPQLDVRLLRHPRQERERNVSVHRIAQHHHADGLVDHRPSRTDGRYGIGQPLLHIPFELLRDVDVEPGDTAGRAIIGVEPITDHDYQVLLAV